MMSDPPPSSSEELQFVDEGVDYRLVPVRRYSGTGAARVQAMLQCWKRGGRAIVDHAEDFRPDLIIAGTVYQIDNFGAVEAGKKTGAVVLRETRDLWPMTIKQMSRSWRLNPLVPLIQKAEDVACTQMDGLMSTLPNALEHLSTRGLTADRFHFVPQVSIEPAEHSEIPLEMLRELERMKSDADLLCLWMGSFVPATDLTFVLNAFESAGAHFRLAILGRGPMEDQIRAHPCVKSGQAVLLGTVPRQVALSVAQVADVGVASCRNLGIYRFGISLNKIVDYLAAGLPCIMAAPGKAHMVALSGAGVSIPPADISAFKNALCELARLTPQERKGLGQLGLKFVEQNCSTSVIANRVLAIASSIKTA